MRWMYYPIQILLSMTILSIPACGQMWISRQPVDLSYVVTVDNLGSQPLQVVLTVGNITGNEVVLVSGAQDELLGVEAFSPKDTHGNPLSWEVKETQSEVLVGGYSRSISFSKRIIDTKGKDEITVSYTATPSFEDHGETYGYIGHEFGLVSGYNLFLTPESNAEFGSVQVHFELPENWEVITSWQRKADFHYPNREHSQIKKNVLDAWFALGEFELTTGRIRDTDVHIIGHFSLSKANFDNLAQNALSIYKYAANTMDSSPAENYTMVFLPRTPDGQSVYVPSTAYGLARSMNPATFSDWRYIAEDLIRLWIDFEPYSMDFELMEDRWIIDGFAVYFGIHALSAIQETPLNKVQETLDVLYTAYGATILPLAVDVYSPNSRIPDDAISPLAQIDFRHEPENSGARMLKAPTVAYLLDQQIKLMTSNRYNLFDLVRSEYERFVQTGSKANLKVDLKSLTGIDFIDFWDKRIDNDDFQSAPLHLHPADLDLIPYQLKMNMTDKQIRFLDQTPSTRTKDGFVLQLLVTAYGESFLETCGCASNQSGGVARRATAFKQLESLYPDILKIDLGRAFPRHVTDELSEYETRTYFKSMNMMNYDLIVPSVYELWASKDLLSSIESDIEFPVVAANVVDRETKKHVFSPYIVKKTGDLKIGIIGLAPSSSDSYRDIWAFEFETSRYELLDPIDTVQRTVSVLRDKCDLLIVAGDIQPLTIRRMIKAVDGIDLIITAAGYSNVLYPLDPAKPSFGYTFTENYGYKDSTLVVNSRMRTYGFHRLDLTLDTQKGHIKQWVYLNRSLDESIKDDDLVRDVLNDFYSSIESDSSYWSSYDQRFFWALEEQTEFNGGNSYLGVDSCEACHKEIVNHWHNTLHAQALNTLIKKHKNYYPRCVTCHTTGFNYKSGFKINSTALGGVQCEVCHGPGDSHVKWANSQYQDDLLSDVFSLSMFSDQGQNKKLDMQIRSTLDETYCVECHDQDNSPSFEFTKYWEKIKH